jgi:hypothetical protein
VHNDLIARPWHCLQASVTESSVALPPANREGVAAVSFRNVIHDATFDPETLEIMSAAYDGVCKYLNLAD